MNFLSGIHPLFVGSGFAVGFLVGMTGVGGGSLMTPLLILLFGIHPSTAVGTDLLYAAVTKTGGTLVHGLGRTIEWRVVGRLALGSVPLTVLTILFLAWIGPADAAAQIVITHVLSVALIVTALALVFRRRLIALYTRRVGTISPRRTFWLTVAMGAFLGVAVSISSVGAGAIGVTALILLYPELPTARIVGSDIAHAVPLTLIAGIGHWWLGSLDVMLLGSLLIGSLPGIVLGSLIAPRMPDVTLRYVLAATLAIVAWRLMA